MTLYRQGDVALRGIDKLPTNLIEVQRDNGAVVLAYGEVTGHSHALRGARVALFMDTGSGSGRRYLKVDEPSDLSHEEHSTITLPAGLYEVLGQVEYTPAEIRRVAD